MWPTSTTNTNSPGSFDCFAIGFDRRDSARLHDLWDEVIASEQWSEGAMTRRFEDAWSTWNGVGAVAMASWTGGALSALAYAGVGAGDVVLCPSNTFIATPNAALATGARVCFVDSNREDLCMSFADFERKAESHHPKVAFAGTSRSRSSKSPLTALLTTSS
jgi:perosamine synthetase